MQKLIILSGSDNCLPWISKILIQFDSLINDHFEVEHTYAVIKKDNFQVLLG